MDSEQTAKILAIIDVAYPRFAGDIKSNLGAMIKLWSKMFADADYKLVQTAVEQHIRTSTWPPSVADINGTLDRLLHPQLSEQEAWNIVAKAVRKCDLPMQYNSLPAEIKDFMAYRDFYDLAYEDGKISVTASNWMRSYKQFTERKKFERAASPSIKKVIEGYNNMMSLPFEE